MLAPLPAPERGLPLLLRKQRGHCAFANFAVLSTLNHKPSRQCGKRFEELQQLYRFFPQLRADECFHLAVGQFPQSI